MYLCSEIPPTNPKPLEPHLSQDDDRCGSDHCDAERPDNISINNHSFACDQKKLAIECGSNGGPKAKMAYGIRTI